MLLDLRRLFLEEGKSVSFEEQMPNTEEKLWKGHPIASPITLSGMVRNRAGIVTLEYTARFRFHSQCDRCCAGVDREMTYRFTHDLLRQLENEDDDGYIVIPDGMLETEELACSDISLELPTKVLCSEECKGLCPKCGKNLNEGSCSCPAKEVDPRFAKLLQLLEKDK